MDKPAITKKVVAMVSDKWSLSRVAETHDKFSFLFSHIENGVVYEEDRLVIITDKDGEVLQWRK